MPSISVAFEMSDGLVEQAVREDCIAVAREFVVIRDLLVVLASAGVFVLALVRGGHWLWWLAALPAAIYLLLGTGWLLARMWLPRVAKARLAHLPNRRVQVEATDAALSFQTARERLEVAWTELKALKRRPNFWLVVLRSGARLPIPAELLSAEAVALLQARMTDRPTAA
jgi:hypothetical protein